ncbi:hypothetical protein A0H81_13129 [Grifola frondosa]|uniref:Uncharacterized protein n=1 Tax=Grifola frondosa TaxID=5627 RepID=A0A1C7LS50_GRIFR|nr:hypothetical protein A0H81_13129 [Grifola frondosa]
MLRAFIARSAQTPLSVVLDLGEHTDLPQGSQLAALLVEHSSRFVEFVLVAGTGQHIQRVLTNFTHPAPQLRSMTLGRCTQDHVFDAFGGQMQTMRRLDLTLLDNASLVPALLQALASLESLEVLSLAIRNNVDRDFPDETSVADPLIIRLEKLREVHLLCDEHHTKLAMILAHMSLPATTTLDFQFSRLHYASLPAFSDLDLIIKQLIVNKHDAILSLDRGVDDTTSTVVRSGDGKVQLGWQGGHSGLLMGSDDCKVAFCMFPFPTLQHLTIVSDNFWHSVRNQKELTQLLIAVPTVTSLSVRGPPGLQRTVSRVLGQQALLILPNLSSLAIVDADTTPRAMRRLPMYLDIRAEFDAGLSLLELVIGPGAEVPGAVLADLEDVVDTVVVKKE